MRIRASSTEWQFSLLVALTAVFFLVGVTRAVAQDCIDYEGYMHWKRSISTTGNPRHAAADGSYLYLPTVSPSELQIIEINSMQIVGSVDSLGGSPYGAVISGRYLYLLDLAGKMKVIDVFNPNAPEIIGELITPEGIDSAVILGNLAYVGTGSGLLVVDVSDPTAPAVVGSDTTGIHNVHVAGSYAYGTSNGSLRVIDISNPEQPQHVGSVVTPGGALSLDIAGQHAYVADYREGLQVFDLNDPTSPQIVGSVGVGRAVDVKVVGQVAYVVNDEVSGDPGSLRAVDIRDPAAPTLIGAVSQLGETIALAVQGGHAFISDWGNLSSPSRRLHDTCAPLVDELPGDDQPDVLPMEPLQEVE